MKKFKSATSILVDVMGYAAMALLAPAVSFALWQSMHPLTGWPTKAKPPQERLVYAVIREPDPATGDKGAIFLWLEEGDKPRAYEIAYSRRRQYQTQGAMNATAHGTAVVVRMKRQQGSRTIFYAEPRALAPPKR